MILLLSILSPIVELLPNFFMSWWLPDNNKIEAYLKAWPRRVIIVFTVWTPIIYTLGSITSIYLQLSIAVLVLFAFGLRLYFFDSAIQKKLELNTEDIVVNNIPEVIYFIAFSTIGYILYYAVSDLNYLVPLGIVLIFIGAFVMGRYRAGIKTNLKIDIFGRIIFSIGFLINLYNLARATFII